LLFSDTGLSGADISALFAIWTTVGILAEVPSGATADRLSRRGALMAASVLQAAGYVLWIVLPGFPGSMARPGLLQGGSVSNLDVIHSQT